MQMTFGDYDLSPALEVLASFYFEACLLGVAVICFQVLHGGFLEALKGSKTAPVKRVHATPVKVAAATPAVEEPEQYCDYGDRIKACVETQNLQHARELWSGMTAQRHPDERAMTGMVEVMVSCNCTAEAWRFANQTWEEPKLYLLGAIQIYSALLRGFAKARQHQEVCGLYSEMQKRKVAMNTITFNTVLNSVARLGQMHRIPSFLQAMKAEGPRGAPDIVTFSTIVKGYCQSGDVDAALKLLDLMMEMNIKPDEFTFNSLLDGCAKYRRLKEALRLLDLMQEQGVAPSNYTLSIAMKVLGRAHRLSQAFAMAEEVSKQYGFQPNIQVYTCLMQACFHSRRIRKAINLYNQIVEEKLVPVDQKTFSVLAQGCLTSGACDKAVMVVRTSYHLPCAGGMLIPEGPPQGVSAECLQEVLAEFRREKPEEAEMLETELRLASVLARKGRTALPN